MGKSITELRETREKRLSIYKEYSPQDNEYALNRLADGESIDPLKLRSAPLKEYLIPFSATEDYINNVLGNIAELKSTRGYSFIIGDYGAGKTQFRDLFVDRCMEYDVITLKADLGLMSFASFAIAFCNEVRNKITNHYPDLLRAIDPFLTVIEKSSDDAEIYQNLAQILIQLSSKNLNVFIHLDEIDMVPNLEAFTPWANFIVMINQHIEQGVHVVFYMAPRDINRLWDRDSRLIRFNRYISKAISPGNTFGNQITNAVAQILSLYESVNGITLNNSMIQLLALYIDDYFEEMKKLNLRFVNTNFFQIIEFLDNLQTKDYWVKNEASLMKHNIDFSQNIIDSLNGLLKSVTIDFEYNETNYSSEYDSNENSFKLNKSINEESSLLIKVNTSILYSTKSDYKDTFNKIQDENDDEYTIHFFLAESIEGISDIFSEMVIESKNQYLFVVPINSILAHPLILYTNPEYENDFNFKRQLQFWFETISKTKKSLTIFLEKIARDMYESEMKNQLEELRQQLNLSTISENPSLGTNLKLEVSPQDSRGTMGDQSAMVGKLTKAEVEILLRVMAIYSHNLAKKKITIVREVADDLRKNNIINITDEQIISIIKRLINKDFLKETKVQYRKTDDWTVKEIFKYFDLK